MGSQPDEGMEPWEMTKCRYTLEVGAAIRINIVPRAGLRNVGGRAEKRHPSCIGVENAKLGSLTYGFYYGI